MPANALMMHANTFNNKKKKKTHLRPPCFQLCSSQTLQGDSLLITACHLLLCPLIPVVCYKTFDSRDLFIISDRPQVSVLTVHLCTGAPEAGFDIHNCLAHLQNPL